jgi:O-antigen ligase
MIQLLETPRAQVTGVRRPQALEAGLFLLVVALPLAFFPLSEAAFIDAKLLVLALGTMLVWFSGLPADRRLAGPALALVAALGLATVFGVDAAESLVGTTGSTGLVMLVCAVSLVVVAPSMPTALLERAAGWLAKTSLVVAALVVAERLSPDVLDVLARRESFRGATFGNPVFLAGFLSACIPGILHRGRGPAVWLVASSAVVGSGLAVAGQRSGYLLPWVAIAATWWFLRGDRRRYVLAGATILVALVVWSFVPALGTSSEEEGLVVAGQFESLTGERQRVAVFGGNLLAITERPLLGWGPANGWSAYISSATPGQIRTSGRFWVDAHNLPVQVTVISGMVGLAALAWLFLLLIPRVARPFAGRGWAAAAAATLGVYSLYEPLDVTLTPLLFLLAGAAAGGREPAAGGRESRERTARAAVVVTLAAATLIAGVNLGASALEQWGRTHFEARWAVERAWAIAPWRLSAGEALAIDLAIDGRAGDAVAAAEAREVIRRIVSAHPMNPGVRILAADVELLLRNFPGTQGWIREHLEIFPNDDVRVPAEEPGFTIPG